MNTDMPRASLSPAQLDSQCKVSIHHWVDLDSEEHRMVDDDRALTKKFLRIGFEGGILSVDARGYVWGHGKDPDVLYPFHIEHSVPGRAMRLIGIRIAKKAAN